MREFLTAEQAKNLAKESAEFIGSKMFYDFLESIERHAKEGEFEVKSPLPRKPLPVDDLKMMRRLGYQIEWNEEIRRYIISWK